MITDKEILDYVETLSFDADEVNSGDIWQDFCNESGEFLINIWLDEKSNLWKATAYEDNFNSETGYYQANFETNYREGVTLNYSLVPLPEPTKSPLENTISTVFQYGATLQKEINSLKDTQTAEGKERLSELLHERQTWNEALLNELQEDRDNGEYYLGHDNPW